MATDSRLQSELKQTRPFRSPAQEAGVALLRTADLVRRHIATVCEPEGVTIQQYNVLRILRGSPRGLPTLEIAERLIEQAPGITRLLDRLENKGLVRRERSTEDRRLVHCFITPDGLELLRRLDRKVDAADEHVVRNLDRRELKSLIRLLEQLRTPLE